MANSWNFCSINLNYENGHILSTFYMQILYFYFDILRVEGEFQVRESFAEPFDG